MNNSVGMWFLIEYCLYGYFWRRSNCYNIDYYGG